MATAILHPAAMPPMPAVARILARYDRPSLEGFISVAIGLLDVLDGDPDVEANGDELDGANAAEDEFQSHSDHGPGCPISDQPEEDDHSGGNVEDEGEREEGC